MTRILTGALLALAFGAGFLVSDWRDQGAIERLRTERAELQEALAKSALRQIERGLVRAARILRTDRRLVARLIRERDAARAAAAENRRRLEDALAHADLDGCTAPDAWRVLDAKYRRLARQHAAAAGDPRSVDGGPGRAAAAAWTCADAFRYAAALLDGWDDLARQLRALQAAVRERETP